MLQHIRCTSVKPLQSVVKITTPVWLKNYNSYDRSICSVVYNSKLISNIKGKPWYLINISGLQMQVYPKKMLQRFRSYQEEQKWFTTDSENISIFGCNSAKYQNFSISLTSKQIRLLLIKAPLIRLGILSRPNAQN